MKYPLKWLLSCIILIMIGFLTLIGFDTPWLNTIGATIILSTVLLLTYTTIRYYGKITPKVYNFTHLYKTTNVTDNQTTIVKKLNKKNITQLKKLQGTISLHEIFKRFPVLIESKHNSGIHTVINGYVYASDHNEAYDILHTYHFHKLDEEGNNTPYFSF